MLAISWFSSRWLIERFRVPTELSLRLVMGGLAFAFLMVAEVGLSIFGFGRTVWHSGAIGLSGCRCRVYCLTRQRLLLLQRFGRRAGASRSRWFRRHCRVVIAHREVFQQFC